MATGNCKIGGQGCLGFSQFYRCNKCGTVGCWNCSRNCCSGAGVSPLKVQTKPGWLLPFGQNGQLKPT